MTKEQDKVLQAYCEQTGISGSAAIQMAFSVGIRTVQMANDPDWQKYFTEQFQKGVIKLPEETKFDKQIDDDIDQVIKLEELNDWAAPKVNHETDAKKSGKAG
jgi:uncharacterized protein YaiE (UPF0345 family)